MVDPTLARTYYGSYGFRLTLKSGGTAFEVVATPMYYKDGRYRFFTNETGIITWVHNSTKGGPDAKSPSLSTLKRKKPNIFEQAQSQLEDAIKSTPLKGVMRDLQKLPRELERELRRAMRNPDRLLRDLQREMRQMLRELNRMPQQSQRMVKKFLGELERELEQQSKVLRRSLPQMLKNLPPEVRNNPVIKKMLGNLMKARKAGNETGVIATLRTVVTAQQTFRILRKKVKSNRPLYGTFSELQKHQFISSKIKTTNNGLSFVRYGYKFTLKLTQNDTNFEVLAVPTSPQSGKRSFFTNNGGRVTYEMYPKVPNANSQGVN